MQPKDFKLVILTGCERCTKICQWRSATADPDRADANTQPYKCNNLMGVEK